MDLLCDLPWWVPALLIVLFFAAIWLTDLLAWQRGRRFGQDETNFRHLLQGRLDHQRGFFEGVRRAAEWMRAHGHVADATRMPVALLEDEQPASPR